MPQLKQIHQLGELFHRVQMEQIFADSKTFPDSIPKIDLERILLQYEQEKDFSGFNLKEFIITNFSVPQTIEEVMPSQARRPVRQHIEHLWNILTRQPDNEVSSIIPIPYPYVIPGGRFREIYYWDSYFTMIGLVQSGRLDLLQFMVDNFTYLIDLFGYIPNGNRTYYLGRSQPPFYSLMVRLFSESKSNWETVQDKDILVKYLPQLEKEYNFWMDGKAELDEDNIAVKRVVLLPDYYVLNRYWDEHNTPRPESYKEDVELANQAPNNPEIYRDIRAAAESGWDFSSRWFSDPQKFSTIHTTDIIPVDLNCLLLHLEHTIAEIYETLNDTASAKRFKQLAIKRKSALEKFFWNADRKFYFDYNYKQNEQTNHYTAAAVFPLFFNYCSSAQAEDVAFTFHSKFLREGGVLTTLQFTGQQWDAPNGWAPLQYLVIKGLSNYGMLSLAAEIASRWIKLNIKVYKDTGKLMEKYNVEDLQKEAGGGEYPSQDGFGWTNGVLLYLIKSFYTNKKAANL